MCVVCYWREQTLATQFLRNGIQCKRRFTSCLKFASSSLSPPRNARACLNKYYSMLITFLFCSHSCSSCASTCFLALDIGTSTCLLFCSKCFNRSAASLSDVLVKCPQSLPFLAFPRLFILSHQFTPLLDQFVSALPVPAPSPNKLQAKQSARSRERLYSK